MKVLVTGGAGFIGRWIVKNLLENHEVLVFDNLSNGSTKNLEEFKKNPNFAFTKGDVRDQQDLTCAFKDIELCIHLAAQINVQESLDHPDTSFANNIIGTYNVLERCRKSDAKLVLVGTCMVYDTALKRPINEEHPTKPASPYAGSKLAAENLALSYYNGYGLPIVILRPFNTYGPCQKSSSEGGVVSIFIQRYLAGRDLQIYGDGEQTRDLLYVEDCAEFIVNASFSEKAIGEIINAGTGLDIAVNNLALLICKDKSKIKNVPHIHPQSEIRQLVCDFSKATKLLGWRPKTSLEQGIEKTTRWMQVRATAFGDLGSS